MMEPPSRCGLGLASASKACCAPTRYAPFRQNRADAPFQPRMAALPSAAAAVSSAHTVETVSCDDSMSSTAAPPSQRKFQTTHKQHLQPTFPPTAKVQCLHSQDISTSIHNTKAQHNQSVGDSRPISHQAQPGWLSTAQHSADQSLRETAGPKRISAPARSAGRYRPHSGSDAARLTSRISACMSCADLHELLTANKEELNYIHVSAAMCRLVRLLQQQPKAKHLQPLWPGSGKHTSPSTGGKPDNSSAPMQQSLPPQVLNYQLPNTDSMHLNVTHHRQQSSPPHRCYSALPHTGGIMQNRSIQASQPSAQPSETARSSAVDIRLHMAESAIHQIKPPSSSAHTPQITCTESSMHVVPGTPHEGLHNSNRSSSGVHSIQHQSNLSRSTAEQAPSSNHPATLPSMHFNDRSLTPSLHVRHDSHSTSSCIEATKQACGGDEGSAKHVEMHEDENKWTSDVSASNIGMGAREARSATRSACSDSGGEEKEVKHDANMLHVDVGVEARRRRRETGVGEEEVDFDASLFEVGGVDTRRAARDSAGQEEVVKCIVELLHARASSQVVHMRPRQLSNFLWATAKIRVQPSPQLFSVLMSEMMAKLDSCSPRDLINTLYATACLKRQPPQAWLDAACSQVIKQARTMNAQDAANLAWSLGAMRYKPPGSNMDRLLLRTRGLLRYMQPQHLANLGWSLASLGHTPPSRWLPMYLRSLMQAQHLLEPQHLAIVMWSLGKINTRVMNTQARTHSVAPYSSAVHVLPCSTSTWEVGSAELLGQLGLPICATSSDSPSARVSAASHSDASSCAKAPASSVDQAEAAPVSQPLPTCGLPAVLPASPASKYFVDLQPHDQLQSIVPDAWLHDMLCGTKELLGSCSPQHLSNLAWGLGHCNRPLPSDWSETFLQAAQVNLPHFKAWELISLIWGVSHFSEPLPQDWLQDYVAAAGSLLPTLGAAQLVTLLSSLQRQNWPLPATTFASDLLARLGAQFHELSPALLMCMLRQLSDLPVRPSYTWLDSLLQCLQPHLATMSPAKLCFVVYTVSKLCKSKDSRWSYTPTPAFLQALVSRMHDTLLDWPSQLLCIAIRGLWRMRYSMQNCTQFCAWQAMVGERLDEKSLLLLQTLAAHQSANSLA